MFRSTIHRTHPARRRQLAVAGTFATTLLAIALALVPTSVQGVHDTGVFELDGNAALDGGGDDFDGVFAGSDGSFDRIFVDDSPQPDATHHEPSNKDPQPLADWGCVVRPNVTNKLDIRHAYAATYAVDGRVITYFGADRDTTEGSANLGVWFFQDDVRCDPATGTFTGAKHDGDVLIVSEFAGGGTFPGIDVYRWNDPTPLAPESGDETLALLVSGAYCGAIVDPTDPHDVCGTANETPIDVAWEVASGRNPIDALAFFEGGMDLTALAPESCYRTFLTETRSSQALDATLTDLTFGHLFTCATIGVEKVTDPSGDAQLFDFAVTGPPPFLNAFQIADASPTHYTSIPTAGSYAVTETLPASWQLAGAQCRGGPFGDGAPYANGAPIAIEAGDQVVCTFVDTVEPMQATSITVDKVTAPENHPQAFAFVTSGGPAPGVNDAFQLADASPSHTTPGLLPGTYAVTETLPGGWDLAGASCRGGPFGEGAAYANGAPIVLAAGDEVVCTFVDTLRSPPTSTSLTVDKVVLAPGDPLEDFDFVLQGVSDPTVSEPFTLDDAAVPHTTPDLPPGTYTVTEALPAGWALGVRCVGGPFGAGAPYENGAPIVLAAGDNVFCAFTNLLLRPAPTTFCGKTAVRAILNPTSGRFPGNLGLDHLVRIDLGESIQAVVDIAADFNADGYVLIGVIKGPTTALGGTTVQSVVVDRAFDAPFGLVGCSVTLRDPSRSDAAPAGWIRAGATGPDIFVADLHGSASEVAGWVVEGTGRTLRNVNATGSATGIVVRGSGNTIHNGKADANTGAGLSVEGHHNVLDSTVVTSNEGAGVTVRGDGNDLLKLRVGDRNKGNRDDGIAVFGAGTLVQECQVYANRGDGLDVTGGSSALPNVLRKNRLGDASKGNAGNGLRLSADAGNGAPSPWELEANIARGNGEAGFLVEPGAAGHQLRGNLSGGTTLATDNAGCEFVVAAGNLNATGNKANGVSIPGSGGTPFPTGCLGTP